MRRRASFVQLCAPRARSAFAAWNFVLRPRSASTALPSPVVTLGIEPGDLAERRAFETRLARRRAEGGPRAAALIHAEEARVRDEEKAKRRAANAAKRAEKRGLGAPSGTHA